jgi:hypothetical protein
LLAKLQERRGVNQQVQLILDEPRGEEPRVIFITRGGFVIGEDMVNPRNTINGLGIIRASKKAPLFDPTKEKHTFEEVRREFVGEHASYREKQEVKECEMPPAFYQSIPFRKGKGVSKLMDFLYTCINMIKYERVVQRLQHLQRQYEIGRVDPLLSRAMKQVSRKKRKSKELHLSAHIGDYDINCVVLNLGSKVNVMTKKTWALMGKPKFIYSNIRLRMDNLQAVSPFGRLEHVPVEIDGVRTFKDFKVIEIFYDSCPYPVLLGIDWDFNNLTIVDLKKRRITFDCNGLRVIAPLDPDEVHIYT